jgi:hypothetical protein
MYAKAGLDAKAIVAAVFAALGREIAAVPGPRVPAGLP